MNSDDRTESIQEIQGDDADESLPVSIETQKLLDRRHVELRDIPDNVLTWEEIKRSVRNER